MNLFYLDDDLDRCAEAHIDKHVGKMQLEAAQLLCTALWVDKLLGFVPRALNPDELAVIKAEMSQLAPNIDDRQHLDIPYKAAHVNHPSCVWVRSSYEHYAWTHCYVNALDSENVWRGNKPHKSCTVVNRLPLPANMLNKGWQPPFPAMPEELKTGNILEDYRTYYIRDKAAIASWKRRGQPDWWS